MKHPFAEETVDRKRAYVVGVTIVVLESGDMSARQEKYLEKLINDLELPKDELDKILKVARQYQAIKDKVVSILDTPYKKYCFLMELHSLFYQTTEKDEKRVKGIGEFTKLLDVTQPELNLVKEVYMNLIYKNKLYLSEASKKCEEEQIFLGPEVLRYFADDEAFTLQEERVLKKGEELIITKSYKISGLLKVLEGARLIFENAKVELHAPIQVDGGYLEIRNSQFKTGSDMGNYMFIVMRNTVHIADSTFDGNHATGIWCQANGELFIENSSFMHTSHRPCINLWECEVHINKSNFIKCQSKKSNGGAIYTNSNIEVIESTFEDCSAYNGAAIYRLATAIPWVETSKDPRRPKSNRQKEENQMLQLFGKKIDFVPIPKRFGQIAYPLVLRENIFRRCKAYNKGVVCVYKSQVVLNKNNTFDTSQEPNIYYYE